MATKRFDGLDGLRGIAALAVLYFHLFATSGAWVVAHGYLAVDFFFLLSGFVIAHAYADRLANGLTVAAFLRARLVRLYPLIVAGAAIGLVGFSRLYEPKTLAIVFLTGLLLLPTPLAPKNQEFMALPVNPPSWSLFFELAANLAFALFAPLLGGRGLVTALLFSGAGLVAEIAWFGSANLGSTWPNFWAGGFRVAFSFLCGVALYRGWRAGAGRWAHAPWTLLALALTCVLCAPARLNVHGLYDTATILLAFPAIVLCGANVAVSGRWAVCCAALGDLSYPSYILQGGLAPHMRDLPEHLGISGAPALALLTVLSGVYLAVCWIVLKYYDEPIRGLLQRRRTARPAAPVRSHQAT